MKLEELVLSIKQAKHLQDLGLNMRDASLLLVSKTYIQSIDKWGCLDNEEIPYSERKWVVNFNDLNYGGTSHIEGGYEYVPTYTLQEVLDKLPKMVFHEQHCYWLYYDFVHDIIHYSSKDFKECAFVYDGLTKIDNVYFALCWVLENGYLKEDNK